MSVQCAKGKVTPTLEYNRCRVKWLTLTLLRTKPMVYDNLEQVYDPRPDTGTIDYLASEYILFIHSTYHTRMLQPIWIDDTQNT